MAIEETGSRVGQLVWKTARNWLKRWKLRKKNVGKDQDSTWTEVWVREEN